MDISWKNIQIESAGILDQGLKTLYSLNSLSELSNIPDIAGNYMLFENNKPIYIGQSQHVPNRIRQHLSSKKFKDREISFTLLPVNLGRKEIEEYGCFYFKGMENKFHHHRVFDRKDNSLLNWNTIQQDHEEILRNGILQFKNNKAIPWKDAILSNSPGVYLLYKNTDILYIGEGISLSGRYAMHVGQTRMSVLRRKIATRKLGFSLKTKQELGYDTSTDSKRSFLSNLEDVEVSKYLDDCTLKFMEVDFGRLELESQLIHLFKPELNSKNNN